MGSTRRDIVRQSSIIAAMVFMITGAAVGGGAFGGESVAELQNGALSAQGSYLAPAGPAFAIWSVIYLGLAAYAIWQALPSQRDTSRQRAIGWWVAGSMVLNGLWLVAARYLNLVATVIVICALLAVLARIVVMLGRDRASDPVDLALFDAVSGLHLGWVTIATVANTAAWLTQTLPAGLGEQADAWGIGVLVVVAVIGAASALATHRLTPALATSWGLVWVAIGRLSGEPESRPIAIAALIVATVVVVSGVIGLRRARRAAP